jgi:hypothetical protein
MPSVHHEQLITGAEIALGGKWSRIGFAQAVSLALMEYRLDARGTDDAIPASQIDVVPDAYQIEPSARTIKTIEVGGMGGFDSRLNLAERLDFESWTFDIYWVDLPTGMIFKMRGDTLASVSAMSSFTQDSQDDLLKIIKGEAEVVGRARPIVAIPISRSQQHSQLRGIERQRLQMLKEHVWPYYREPEALKAAA